MQLDKIFNDFEINNAVVFGKDAIVIYKKGDIDEMLIVELTAFFKQVEQFELLFFSEVNISFGDRQIVAKRLGEYYLAIIADKENFNEKVPFHFFLMYNKVKRELL
jgi:hypothetical protein